jgi:hypothetical protein
MLGPVKPRRLSDPIVVSLEDLVPPDNFYRHLEAMLDLSFIREWVRDLYAERGRPSRAVTGTAYKAWQYRCAVSANQANCSGFRRWGRLIAVRRLADWR